MAKRRSSESSGVLMAAALAATTALQNPQVQQQLVEASSSMADGVKTWKARRAERRLENPDTSSTARSRARKPLSQKVTARFGNQKLERRVKNLRANVSLVRTSVGPEAEEALAEVDQVVDRLSVAVAMAANLPFGKRQKAHREIDSVLDELEKALFSQILD